MIRRPPNEVKSHLLIAKELRFLDEGRHQQALELIEILSVKLNNLIAATKSYNRLQRSLLVTIHYPSLLHNTEA